MVFLCHELDKMCKPEVAEPFFFKTAEMVFCGRGLGKIFGACLFIGGRELVVCFVCGFTRALKTNEQRSLRPFCITAAGIPAGTTVGK
ncbi:hypothetical protein BARVI_03020 [Barnesiella viscericola DSM 18177]|uniref:Uncharacterized protein n=1 Tax=Barnesiella viscericola DSM 18177 TaxID=880074 RepID=W0EVQ4_9BACT|nr:hypothetical protein BARVI_03020 [Barnesiella viscericola DSM 18177]